MMMMIIIMIMITDDTVHFKGFYLFTFMNILHDCSLLHAVWLAIGIILLSVCLSVCLYAVLYVHPSVSDAMLCG